MRVRVACTAMTTRRLFFGRHCDAETVDGAQTAHGVCWLSWWTSEACWHTIPDDLCHVLPALAFIVAFSHALHYRQSQIQDLVKTVTTATGSCDFHKGNVN